MTDTSKCAFYKDKDGICRSPINKTCEFCKNIPIDKCYYKQLCQILKQKNSVMATNIKYFVALEDIKKMITKPYCCKPQDILDRIEAALKC